jgi:hypothetical protein
MQQARRFGIIANLKFTVGNLQPGMPETVRLR